MRSPSPAGALFPVVLLSASLASPAAIFAQGEIIETITGGGPNGLPATSVDLVTTAIVADPAGGFYLATWDYTWHARIYKVDGSGLLTLVAGTFRDGVQSNYGDGGPARDARLAAVFGLLLDPSGNLYAADTSARRVWRIDGATGTITTVADSSVGFPLALLEAPRGISTSARGARRPATGSSGSTR